MGNKTLLILALHRVVRNFGDFYITYGRLRWEERETRLLYTKGKPVEQQHLIPGLDVHRREIKKSLIQSCSTGVLENETKIWT